MSERPVRVGLCQMLARADDAEDSRERSFAAAQAAFDQGASIVLLPELIVPGYGTDPERMGPLAEPLDGPTVNGWVRIARDRGGHLAGGFCERDGDAIFNSAVLVDGDGVVVHYRKLHLFGAEKGAFAPGDRGLPVADTPLGRIGLCVCYDLRFVEVVRILALRGAELILVPTAWVAGFDAEPWDRDGVASQAHGALFQANLSQVFVACASQAGDVGERRFLGSSLVADPRGLRACGPLAPDRAETVVVTLELADARRARERGTLVHPREDRRSDLYAVAIDGELL